MATFKPNPAWSIIQTIKMSPPVNTTSPYDKSTLAGKTILITGGCSGLCAGFAREWASHGANIIIGDINDEAGAELIAELRSLPGSSGNHHYQHCDVTKWEDQLALFKLAIKVSPNGALNGVVAGAGIVEPRDIVNGPVLDIPHPLPDDPNTPPEPELKVYNVTLTGVMYTTQLAIFYLEKNPTNTPGNEDRHLLLISSIAGVSPLPGQVEYTVAKHGVMGLFRVLRASTWRQGIRCNVINPYFVHTPLINTKGMMLLAGSGVAKIEDVVDAGTRLMADEKIVGRGLVIGPKFKVVDDAETGETRLAGKKDDGAATARVQPVWDIYAHDYEEVEVFVWRFIAMCNLVRKIKGWLGFFSDVLTLLTAKKPVAGKSE